MTELIARASAPVLLLGLTLVGLVFTACGGTNGGSPTGPGSGSQGGLTAPSVGITEVSVKHRTVNFTWNRVPGATGYVLELGRTPGGGSQFAAITLEGAVTSYVAADVPAGVSFARVRAKDASSSVTGPELRFVVPDMRDIIEALFFQTGPNAQGPPRVDSVMLGWAQGTLLPTRVAGLSDQQYGDVERMLQQIEDATNGSVRATFAGRLSDEAASSFTLVNGELQLVVHPDMLFYCTNWTAILGCGDYYTSSGVISAARAIAVPSAPAVVLMHEIGHVALGLFHIQLGPGSPGETWPGLPQPVMAGGHRQPVQPVLTAMELDAIKVVYAAGLRGGALRSAFYAAGLIQNP